MRSCTMPWSIFGRPYQSDRQAAAAAGGKMKNVHRLANCRFPPDVGSVAEDLDYESFRDPSDRLKVEG